MGKPKNAQKTVQTQPTNPAEIKRQERIKQITEARCREITKKWRPFRYFGFFLSILAVASLIVVLVTDTWSGMYTMTNPWDM